jgi:hypothetical protein
MHPEEIDNYQYICYQCYMLWRISPNYFLNLDKKEEVLLTFFQATSLLWAHGRSWPPVAQKHSCS